MADNPGPKRGRETDSLAAQIERRARRKLKARRGHGNGVWPGLGTMGMIGWSVVIPMLLGLALGVWLDKHHPRQHTWTLALLMAGLALGCFNAWLWISREQRALREEQERDEDD